MSVPPIEPRVRAREEDLWRRFSRHRDSSARDELVALYLPVARRMASRYAGISEPFDDLFQVASLALVNAVDRFDYSRGTPFLGFAKPTILGELKRHFRDKVWTVRVPRSIHDMLGRVDKAAEELSHAGRRPPSVEELSRHLSVDPEDVLEALEAGANRRPVSLDAPPGSEDGDHAAPPEWVGEREPGYELIEGRLMLQAVLPGLDPRAADVLRLRFLDELSQSQIAERLGCSRMQISRLLRQTLEQLRAASEASGGGRTGRTGPTR